MKSIALALIFISSSMALAHGGINAGRPSQLAPIKLPKPHIPPQKITPDSTSENTQSDLADDLLCAGGVTESCG